MHQFGMIEDIIRVRKTQSDIELIISVYNFSIVAAECATAFVFVSRVLSILFIILEIDQITDRKKVGLSSERMKIQK